MTVHHPLIQLTVDHGLVALLNAARYESNQTSIGFLNPTLYSRQYKSYYNDIDKGKLTLKDTVDDWI
jgi:hypothetical protein